MNDVNNEFWAKTYTTEEQQRILDYWTPERKASAKPIPISELVGSNVEGSPNNSNRKKVLELTGQGEPVEADVTKLPFYKAGRMFVTIDGVDHKGSAQFVGHCQIVLTAAHVVRDIATGKYYDNIVFSAGYKEWDKSEDYVFDIVRTPDEYVGGNAEDIESVTFDYAFCRTKERTKSGWMNLQIGIPYQQIWSIGYPGNYNDGKSMYVVEGYRGDVHNYVGMLFNPFGHGASGGAWIANLTNNNSDNRFDNVVVGLNSKKSNDYAVVYSPYFNHDTLSLFNAVLDVTRENPRTCDISVYHNEIIEEDRNSKDEESNYSGI